jgi:hypothetical protein
MGFGHGGRTQLGLTVVANHAPTRLNRVRPRGPESAAGVVAGVADLFASMGSGHGGRNQGSRRIEPLTWEDTSLRERRSQCTAMRRRRGRGKVARRASALRASAPQGPRQYRTARKPSREKGGDRRGAQESASSSRRLPQLRPPGSVGLRRRDSQAGPLRDRDHRGGPLPGGDRQEEHAGTGPTGHATSALLEAAGPRPSADLEPVRAGEHPRALRQRARAADRCSVRVLAGIGAATRRTRGRRVDHRTDRGQRNPRPQGYPGRIGGHGSGARSDPCPKIQSVSRCCGSQTQWPGVRARVAPGGRGSLRSCTNNNLRKRETRSQTSRRGTGLTSAAIALAS